MIRLPIELCMGSSCFARGNAKALENLERYIEKHNLADRIDISGHLCLGTCSDGPNMKIGGVLHQNVRPESVVPLVQQALEEQGKVDG